MHLVLFGWKWGGEAGSTAHAMNLNVRKHVEEGGGGVYNDKKDNLDDEVWEGGREGDQPPGACSSRTTRKQKQEGRERASKRSGVALQAGIHPTTMGVPSEISLPTNKPGIRQNL